MDKTLIEQLTNTNNKNYLQQNQKQYFLNTKLSMASNLIKFTEDNNLVVTSDSSFLLPALKTNENCLNNITNEKLILN